MIYILEVGLAQNYSYEVRVFLKIVLFLAVSALPFFRYLSNIEFMSDKKIEI